MKKTFRPSARLISTIGEDIIKDMYAAVVELVKNAYDADATNVLIKFTELADKTLHISIIDDGHGMSESVVEDKWLVPSTSDKLLRRKSPKGRIMQGRKGIGRFAAAVLGEKLNLSTISQNHQTYLTIDWDQFMETKYLDEVLVDITTSATTQSNGTKFDIYGSEEKLKLWNDNEIGFLHKELRKLLTPIDSDAQSNTDVFNITLQFEQFGNSKYANSIMEISPLPLLDYYDYRISGAINSDGKCELVYQNKNSGIQETITDFIFRLSDKESFAGQIKIDFRIFDRDPEAIENLVFELVNSGGEKLGKNEVKNLLNDISGVSIFRNRFRIRPYGDDGNDWLSLDKKRVQNPAQKIGANQISGIIEIQDEEISCLVEKSARDGLKEDSYYDGLVSVISQLLIFVELKRFSFRQKTGKGRKNHLFSGQLSILTDFSEVKNRVVTALEESNVSPQKVEEISVFIDKDINDKLRVAQEIEKQIAMYQGQATLGKIMDVVMHEGRKPLAWIKNQTSILNRAYARYLKTSDADALNKVLRIIEETPSQMNLISDLFARLNSLATRKRSAMKSFSVCEVVTTCLEIFADEINRKGIHVEFTVEDETQILGWREDILAAVANIIENAIFWVDYSSSEKMIKIEVSKLENLCNIAISNNGPTIIKDLLFNDSLFIPGISGKITETGSGTGLGLAIAGESVSRNDGTIKVVDVQQGAKFIISLPIRNEE